MHGDGEHIGDIFKAYPDKTFGSIGAWAWGYSRVVDALLKIGGFDTGCIAFTGHSRGAKTAMLAGVLDERAAIVNPNETCQGACSCYRLNIRATTEDGGTMRSERLSDLAKNYPTWIGPKMPQYADDVTAMPFNSHYLKALVAPRILLIGDVASDIWANPAGTWQTSLAASEVYKLYGKEKNLIWYFRRGYHYHKKEDLLQLVNVINHYNSREELNKNYYRLPFKKFSNIFDWKCPVIK